MDPLPIYVLSIDGGGILGIIPLKILDYIEQETGRPICHLFKIISGTSTGGIISLGLTVPGSENSPLYSAAQLLDLYQSKARDIFSPTRWGAFCKKRSFTRALHSLFASSYSKDTIQHTFSSLLGKTTLSQSLAHVLVPAYDIGSLKSPRVKIFNSLKSKNKQHGHTDTLITEVALATSAVPTYFPPHFMPDPFSQGDALSHCFVDGGVAINDPSLLAYAEAKRCYPKRKITLLSLGIGQGQNSYHTVIKKKSPGILAWGKAVPNLVVSPQLSIYRMLLNRALRTYDEGSHYIRIQCSQARMASRFDDISPENIQWLEMQAHQTILAHKTQLTQLIKSLREIPPHA
jgi:patatin-like phospholipase/acyl hydrolase